MGDYSQKSISSNEELNELIENINKNSDYSVLIYWITKEYLNNMVETIIVKHLLSLCNVKISLLTGESIEKKIWEYNKFIGKTLDDETLDISNNNNRILINLYDNIIPFLQNNKFFNTNIHNSFLYSKTIEYIYNYNDYNNKIFKSIFIQYEKITKNISIIEWEKIDGFGKYNYNIKNITQILNNYTKNLISN